MHVALTSLIDRLDNPSLAAATVIRWGSPVPAFGDPASSSVGTLGINPSNREFVDETGSELVDELRRFHSLGSLGINSWAEVDARHLRLIIESCRSYFAVNPYDRWFRRLDTIVAAAGASYYDSSRQACHLDLIPYATENKWSELPNSERSLLMRSAGNALGLLLQGASVRTLILNGSSVVDHFEHISDRHLKRTEMPSWALPRSSGADVMGYAYSGVVGAISGIELGYELLVLGFNHNIQGSFGVSRSVVDAIRDWVSQATKGMPN